MGLKDALSKLSDSRDSETDEQQDEVEDSVALYINLQMTFATHIYYKLH